MVTLEGLLRERIVRLRQELGILESAADALEALPRAPSSPAADVLQAEALPSRRSAAFASSSRTSRGLSADERVRRVRVALERARWRLKRDLEAELVPRQLSRYQLDRTLVELLDAGIIERRGATSSRAYSWKRAQEAEDDDQEGDPT